MCPFWWVAARVPVPGLRARPGPARSARPCLARPFRPLSAAGLASAAAPSGRRPSLLASAPLDGSPVSGDIYPPDLRSAHRPERSGPPGSSPPPVPPVQVFLVVPNRYVVASFPFRALPYRRTRSEPTIAAHGRPSGERGERGRVPSPLPSDPSPLPSFPSLPENVRCGHAPHRPQPPARARGTRVHTRLARSPTPHPCRSWVPLRTLRRCRRRRHGQPIPLPTPAGPPPR